MKDDYITPRRFHPQCIAFWNTATCSALQPEKECFPVRAWLFSNQGALNAASKLLRVFDVLIPFDKQFTRERPGSVSRTHTTAAAERLLIFTEGLTSKVCNKGIYGSHPSPPAGCLALALYVSSPWLVWRSPVVETTPKSRNKALMLLHNDLRGMIVTVRALPYEGGGGMCGF